MAKVNSVPWTLRSGFTEHVIAIASQEVTCSQTEYAIVQPPEGNTCGQFLNAFVQSVGGYVNNPRATTNCQYCSTRTTDEFLAANFNIFYSHRWRNIGILVAFCIFNVSFRTDLRYEQSSNVVMAIQLVLLYLLTYVFRVRKGRILGFWTNRKSL